MIEVEGITTLTNGDDKTGFLVIFPFFGKFKKPRQVDLIQSNGLGKFDVKIISVDKLYFKLFDGLAVVISGLGYFRRELFGGFEIKSGG